ncbi:hypothetical protein IFO70_00005, partial [Phormidium tenue FACHB-886]|nr:hypothetical protein [Phormidium tenue FACHB-886]
NISLTEQDYQALLALAAETGRKPHAIAQDALRQAIGTTSPRSVQQSDYSG